MGQTSGTVGSTVVGFKYRDGVIIAADTGSSYGYLAMDNTKRIFKLTDKCLIGFSGKLTDMQALHEMVVDELNQEVIEMDPQGIHKLFQRVLYSARSRLQLLEVSVVIGGVHIKPNEVFLTQTDEGGRTLSVVNSKGNFWFDSTVATGLAGHLILPILRDAKIEDLDRNGAKKLMERCMRVLCYKDCKASNMIQMGFCEESGVTIEDPYPLDTNWDIGVKEGEIVLR